MGTVGLETTRKPVWAKAEAMLYRGMSDCEPTATSSKVNVTRRTCLSLRKPTPWRIVGKVKSEVTEHLVH